MVGRQDRIVIAEVAARRVAMIAVVLGVSLAAFVYVGLVTDNIAFASPHLDRDGAGFTFVTVGIAGLFALPIPYLTNAILRRGVGLYIANGRLVLVARRFRSVPLDQIMSIALGREGIFEGEPISIRFNLPEGRAMTVSTVWFKTPVTEMVSRLTAAGVSVPVRPMASKTSHGGT